MRQLERLVAQAQVDSRVPAISVALRRADRSLWSYQVGQSGNPEAPLDAESSFRIGSITKTFTAVLIMQCRDQGLLGLDDPVGKHLDLPRHGELSIRRLLSHTAGLQREPHGDVWDTLEAPDQKRLLAQIADAEALYPQARRFHYSNLGYALLGHAAARLLNRPWWELVEERIIRPLGMSATTYDATDRSVTGYLVDAYSDHARPEPATDFGGVAPAAQLWSTAADMALWGAFLADPTGVPGGVKVLSAATADEMSWPLTPRNDAVWASAFGLGPMIYPQDGRVRHIGHYGAMPGFLAGAFGRSGGAGNPGGMGVGVVVSSGTAGDTMELCHQLLNEALELDPAEIRPWSPAGPVPERERSALGRWWGEGYEYVFRWAGGALTAHGVDDPPGLAPAVFELVEPDVYRTVSGREVGELLRLTRDDDGVVIRMHWATYRFTRRLETFDGFWASM